ncbi:MAG TPA: Gfo/Idh/MocA family oxidoreductase [bacterium]|nr:Gfo/Idh/MocA family oxidoreductase [bacterium]
MSSVPIRIGIIGAGNIVKTRHLPGFAKEADVQVVAVCNRRRESAEAVAAEWKIPHVVDTPEAVIARDDINVVLVGTTPYLHRDLSVAALKAGKHVFCQARMARNVAEARDMRDEAQRHPDLVNMICPAPHVFPGQRFVRELLEAGELGELRLVRLQHLSDAQLNPQAPWHWRMDWDISGYNVMTLGIYAEILQRWVGKARTVSATGRLFTESRPDPETGAPRPVRIPESVVATGELESGAHFAYTFSSVAAHSPGDRIELYGTKGALIYDVPTHEIRLGKVQPGEIKRVGKVGPKEPPPVVEIPAAVRGEWRVEADFVSAIRNGTPVFPSFADGADYMEFVEAVGRAMEQRQAITLPL